jgi:DNA-binding protein
MMFDINGCYSEDRNSFISNDTVILTDLSEEALFKLTIKTSGKDISKADWDAEVSDALVIIGQYFQTPISMASIKIWPEFLESSQAIAEYVSDLSPYEISQEQIEEQYFGLRGRLTWIELGTLVLRSEDHNLPSKSRQKAVDSLPLATMPPLLVDDSVLEDGYHRIRKLLKDGATHYWAYVIEEAPEPTQELTVKKPSRWDLDFDITP